MKTTTPTVSAALVLLVGFLSSLSLKAEIVCGPVFNPANGHSYYVLSGNSWTGAEAEAVALGGHLATINDANENAWVGAAFPFYSYVWIGLNDAANEGEFVWSSGESVSYRNWWPGEPNNDGGDEDYVHIYNFDGGAWAWNDHNNRETWSPADYDFHGLVEVEELRGVVNPANGSTYHLIGPMTWLEAESQAETMGGHLATINDEDENTFVATVFKLPTWYIWIGLNDLDTEGEFAWSSGEPVTYTKWGSDQPDNNGGIDEKYVYLHTGGNHDWHDMFDSAVGWANVPIFGVVEVTPMEQVTIITDIIESLNFSSSTETALDSKLEEVQEALASGDTAAACDSLKAFINSTKAQAGKKKVSVAEAAQLIEEAEKTRAALGCQ